MSFTIKDVQAYTRIRLKQTTQLFSAVPSAAAWQRMERMMLVHQQAVELGKVSLEPSAAALLAAWNQYPTPQARDEAIVKAATGQTIERILAED